MRETSSLLKGVVEYKLVKRMTLVPRKMRAAYECKLDKEQAIALLIILMDEWPPYVPTKYTLSKRPLKIIWNFKDGRARGGFKVDGNTVRPFVKLPSFRLTAGLVIHEYCHVVTIFQEIEEARAKNSRRKNKHGPIFRSMFDLMLAFHQSDWINLTKKGLDTDGENVV